MSKREQVSAAWQKLHDEESAHSARMLKLQAQVGMLGPFYEVMAEPRVPGGADVSLGLYTTAEQAEAAAEDYGRRFHAEFNARPLPPLLYVRRRNNLTTSDRGYSIDIHLPAVVVQGYMGDGGVQTEDESPEEDRGERVSELYKQLNAEKAEHGAKTRGLLEQVNTLGPFYEVKAGSRLKGEDDVSFGVFSSAARAQACVNSLTAGFRVMFKDYPPSVYVRRVKTLCTHDDGFRIDVALPEHDVRAYMDNHTSLDQRRKN
jgi:hypothetical protein